MTVVWDGMVWAYWFVVALTLLAWFLWYLERRQEKKDDQ